MKFIAIAATDKDGAIGYKNKLLFDCKADMQHFYRNTRGHTVLMGRKTFESIGKPLKHRKNVVLSTDVDFKPKGVQVFADLQAACKSFGKDETVYVIGGEAIYRQTMPLWNELVLTVFDAKAPIYDAVMPLWYNEHWTVKNREGFKCESSGLSGVFLTYERNYLLTVSQKIFINV